MEKYKSQFSESDKISEDQLEETVEDLVEYIEKETDVKELFSSFRDDNRILINKLTQRFQKEKGLSPSQLKKVVDTMKSNAEADGPEGPYSISIWLYGAY